MGSPGPIIEKAGYTLNTSPVCHRANTERQSTTHTLMPGDNLQLPISLMCMSFYCGRKLGYLERTHTDHGDHANSRRRVYDCNIVI